MTVTASRLRTAMEEGSWTQATLARAVGVTQGAISAILVGTTIRSKYLPEIAEQLGVSLAWLRGDEVERAAIKPSPAPPIQPVAFVQMHVALPPERALARMFSGLLKGIDPGASPDELALLLAKRLPIGLSQLRDLRPEPTPVPVARQESAEALAAQPMPDHEPTR